MEVVDLAAERLDLDVDDLVKRYLSGESEYGIANKLGVSRSVIRRRLLERGVEVRGRSEAGAARAARMTPEERMAQVAAAHEAKRGTPNPHESLVQAAKTRQRRGIGISKTEAEFAKLLEDRGVEFVQQLAVDTYNCDFAIHPVAVEVFGGSWHWYGDHIAQAPERTRHFLNVGWHVLIVTDYGGVPLTGETADYVVSFVQLARAHPSIRREYRVVRGRDEVLASGSIDDDEISIEPAFRGRTQMGERKARYLRLRRSGTSQADAVRRCGVSQSSGSRWDALL